MKPIPKPAQRFRRKPRNRGPLFEPLEPRLALAVTVLNPLPDLTVPAVAAPQTFSLAGRFDDTAVTGTVVRFNTNSATPNDRVFVELFDQAAPGRTRTPLTVANFLGYVDRGDYTNTIVHRSVAGFVLQGGAFKAPVAPSGQSGGSPTVIATQPSVTNEPGNSNVRGTIAMAKVDNNPNSATNQWFFNLANNSANLDSQNGGFTAFGRVLGTGMTVIDSLAAVPTFDLGGALNPLPLRGVPNPVPAKYVVQPAQYVAFPSIQRVGELVYTVTNSNPTLLDASVTTVGGVPNLRLDHALGRSGTATITVRAASVFDPTDFKEDQFTVTRAPPTGPTAPTDLFVLPGNGVARLRWTAPASNGGAAITDYVVQYSVNGNSWTTFADGTSTKTSALVTGLTNGMSYVFRVAAVNSVGSGAAAANPFAVTPRSVFVVGAEIGVGSTPMVRLVDANGGTELARTTAFEAAYRGGVRVAMGDLDGDAIPEVAVGSGPGRAGEVRFYRQRVAGGTIALEEILSARTFPFGPQYTGGVEIAVGDVDGDGRDDLVAAMSRGAGTVSVFRSQAGGDPIADTPYRTFTPFGSSFNGGATVAVADVGTFTNGTLGSATTPDKRMEIVVGSGAGISPIVYVYDVSAAPRVVKSISPFSAGRTFGVAVSAGRHNDDAIDDIVISAGRGGGSAVTIVSGRVDQTTPVVLASSAAFAALARPNAAVFMALIDANGDGTPDRLQGTQGDAGGSVGVLRVALNGSSLGGLGSLTGPLRIAAPRVAPRA